MLKTSFVAFQRRKASAPPDTDFAACKHGRSPQIVRADAACLATAAMATTSVVRDTRNAIVMARDPREICCDKTKVAKAVSFNLKSEDCIDGVRNRGNGLRKIGRRQKKKQPSAGGCFGCVSKKGDVAFNFFYFTVILVFFLTLTNL